MAQAVQSKQIARPPNTVDRLTERIDMIQSGCEHEFRPLYEAARDDLPVDVAPLSPGEQISSNSFVVECPKCSSSKCIRYIDQCACCLAEMKRTGSTQIKDQWGPGTGGPVAVVFTCTGCGFSVVTKFWDK